MSVIGYDKKHFEDLCQVVETKLSHNMNSGFYKRRLGDIYRFLFSIQNPGKSEPEIKDYLEYLFFNLWRSNQLAVSINYNQQLDCNQFNEDFTSKHGKVLSTLNLISELKSIDYNLVTNGGQSFIPEDSRKAFNFVLTALKDMLIRNYEDAETERQRQRDS